MENKYYTPDIEEFHVGFEYERLDIEWRPCTVKPIGNIDVEAINEEIYGDIIRVKYLDREDIESFGFEYSFDSSDRYGNRTYYFLNKEWGKNRIERITLYTFKYPNGNMHVCIGTDRYNSDVDDMLFFGYIKNKSELRRVLKQIEVL